ncbi:MAG: hypothetical protein H0U74_04585 [Bradymonadaceae bacterium]|nr:hypothetical protein [Lujinxingiaceae bacterium]
MIPAPKRRTLRHSSLVALVLLLILALCVGCKRKAEDLEVWRNAKGGLEKLGEWAASPEESMEVRTRAVQILLEDGHQQRLPLVLDRIADEQARTQIVSGLVVTVESMWSAQDMPRLTDEMKAGGGQIEVGDSKSVRAKDAAYILQPYASPSEKGRLEAILASWIETEHELRDQLGTATLAQILPRVGPTGMQSAMGWLKETKTPGTVARAIREQADDALKAKMAEIIRARAEEAHPDLNKELEVAVLETEHETIVPYLQRAISDDATELGLIDGAMTLLVKIQGERAAAYLGRVITEKEGLLRWVAANRVIELRGKAGFLSISNALPLETQSYAVPAADSFKKDLVQICNLFSTEMVKEGVTSVSDVLKRALETNRWPAQVMALKCAETTRASDVADSVDALRKSKLAIPGWGEPMTVGQLATQVHAALTLAAGQ